MRTRLRPRPDRRHCPLCRDSLEVAPLAPACSGCGGVLHVACQPLLGRRACSTLGCRGPRRSERRTPIVPLPALPPRPRPPAPARLGLALSVTLSLVLETVFEILLGVLFMI